MKIEVGKTYMTRYGGRVVITRVSNEKVKYPATGFFEGSSVSHSWMIDGRYDERDTCDLDLVFTAETGVTGDGQIDAVNSPKHYTRLGAKCTCGRPIECIDIVQQMNFPLGSAVKYIWRVDDKGDPIENLEKAIKNIQFEIDRRRRGEGGNI